MGDIMSRYWRFITNGILITAASVALAADHAEAPLVESDQGADIADVYAFLDPNDNAKVILAFDVHGFIVPGENGNLSGFDHDVLFRFNIENTGDPVVTQRLARHKDGRTTQGYMHARESRVMAAVVRLNQ